MNRISAVERHRLNSREFHGYGRAELPDRRDRFVTGLVKRIESQGDLVDSANALQMQGGQVCLAFASRAASLSVRDKQLDLAYLAANACALGWLACGDSREAMQRMPVVLRAVELQDGSPEVFAREASASWPTEIAESLLGYSREDLGEYVGKMGFLERGSGATFRFVPDW